MKIAFAINDQNRSIINSLICVFTRAKAYHCELVFENGFATTSQPFRGVYCEPSSYDYYGWTLLPLPWINKIDEMAIRERVSDIIAEDYGYDYLGCALGSFSRIFDVKKRWFCSELCAHLLRPYTPTIQKDRWYSPDLLWKHLVKHLNEQNYKWDYK